MLPVVAPGRGALSVHCGTNDRVSVFFRKPPGPRDPDVLKQVLDSAGLSGRPRRIRCPLCQWQPRKRDRWQCRCGTVWNTFDTRGLCPRCQHQWTQTMCLACHRWSEHEHWYS